MAGFKSFAQRTVLEFEPGITAIVGPNGSGKSNIADAVRWVLGEQKTSSLRSQKGEDLIFNGTSKRAKASMAEVIMVLDNTDGKIALDYNEIEITRRLYRSGESTYLLNGRRAKLMTIVEILAQSGFGQDSYTVIAQGMVERLLLGSSAERAQLFEQASGVRQFELRRQAALKKLAATRDNIGRVEGVIAELEPSQAFLRQQLNMAGRKEALTGQLANMRRDYILCKQADLQKEDIRLQAKHQHTTEKLTGITSKLQQLHKAQAKLQPSAQDSNQFKKQTDRLKKLELQKADLQKEIVKGQAKLAVFEQAKQGLEPQAQQLRNLQTEIEHQAKVLIKHQKELAGYNQKIQDREKTITAINDKLQSIGEELKACRQKLTKSQKKEFLHHAIGLLNLLADQVNTNQSAESTQLTIRKLQRMVHFALEDNAAELALQIGKLQNDITKHMERREEIQEQQTSELIRVRALELDITTLEADLERLQAEKIGIEDLATAAKAQNKTHAAEQQRLTEDQKKLKEIDKKIDQARRDLYELNQTSSSQLEDQQKLLTNIEETVETKVDLERDLQQIQSFLKQSSEQADQLKQLAKQWFSKGLPKGQPKQTNIDMDDIQKLVAELAVIEDIDPVLIKEAQDSEQRLEFLQKQKIDLEKALSDIEQLASQLEKEIAQQFEKGFAKINKAFGANFVKFFNGGEASIELGKAADEQYTIDFMVAPPNKRSHSLSSLSGGEKSLASLALLAAIIEVNPSPFVVLDEVDAAFDDANSLIFAEALQQLAKRSQILIITHNHETMQVAQMLLGITTHGSGDSAIIPLQLKQALQVTPTS